MVIASIELQVISKILTSDSLDEVRTLLEFDYTYYGTFTPHIKFISNHFEKYSDSPDIFTFQAQFPEFQLVKVNEPIEFLIDGLNDNKKRLIMLETFNKCKDLSVEDVGSAWDYISSQCEKAQILGATQPLDLVKESEKRAEQIIEYSRQSRISTGFKEIDNCMYGGMSTVEDLILFVARTNTGKSWIATRMLETAQKNKFPAMVYSPEMQGAFISTRFDTWRGNFQNSQLYLGNYTAEYTNYIKNLKNEETSAFILEDRDSPSNSVTVPFLQKLVVKNKLKLLIIDGLSYLDDVGKSERNDIKYKNLCEDLLRLSKQCGCAVVIFMQANRESRENKDDKGEVFPNIYNIEGSDHPGRIATQVFSARQIYDKHVLDIRLEKSRMAQNQKPTFSYAWDLNIGKIEFLPDSQQGTSSMGVPQVSTTVANNIPTIPTNPSAIVTSNEVNLDDDEDIEF